MNYKIITIALKNGILMGLSFCLYTLLMWLTKLDTSYLYIGQYFDMLIIIVPISFIFRAIWQAQKIEGFTVLHRILVGFLVAFVSFLIYSPFLYAYHNFINPTWFEAVLALEKQNLLAKSTSSHEINLYLQKMTEANNARNHVFNAFIPSVLVMPFVIILISFIFIRKKR